ncbi:hypothetical protein AYI70_g10178 [Smittium culicis]|uniref:Uncharacterized protein n=1 Tax=Smittium culicis TaxID=133412 RepID=A0A1R1X7R8_9FUNG|nr:hypothetical protein AYI70_g10178 [Smittium culicis]
MIDSEGKSAVREKRLYLVDVLNEDRWDMFVGDLVDMFKSRRVEVSVKEKNKQLRECLRYNLDDAKHALERLLQLGCASLLQEIAGPRVPQMRLAETRGASNDIGNGAGNSEGDGNGDLAGETRAIADDAMPRLFIEPPANPVLIESRTTSIAYTNMLNQKIQAKLGAGGFPTTGTAAGGGQGSGIQASADSSKFNGCGASVPRKSDPASINSDKYAGGKAEGSGNSGSVTSSGDKAGCSIGAGDVAGCSSGDVGADIADSESKRAKELGADEMRLANALSSYSSEQVVTGVLKVWTTFYSLILPTLEGIFLPYQLEFRNALLKTLGSEISVRQEALDSFRRIIVNDITLKKIKEYVVAGGDGSSDKEDQMMKLVQMVVILSDNEEQPELEEVAKMIMKFQTT